MITLHKLRIFIEVYQRGSFNSAAGHLLMTQSAVSQHIASLESTLGTALFERSPRGVRPTPAGDVLYRYAVQMMALLADAERTIARLGAPEMAHLSVGATPGISVYRLPLWLQQFQQRTPDVNVSLQTALTADIVRHVLDSEYDLGFLEGELDELDQAALGRMPIGEIAYFVTVSAAHPWAGHQSVHMNDLVGVPFINRQPNSRTRRWLDSVLTANGIPLRNVAELDTPGAIKYALLSEMGVSILPAYAVEREVERGELHTLGIDGLALTRPLLLVWKAAQPFNALQRAFIEGLEKRR